MFNHFDLKYLANCDCELVTVKMVVQISRVEWLEMCVKKGRDKSSGMKSPKCPPTSHLKSLKLFGERCKFPEP